MSYTTIYAFDAKGNSQSYATFRNSWRFCPVIWKYFEDKYLPPLRPDYIPKHIADSDVERFLGYKPSRTLSLPKGPNFDDFSDQQEIWNLAGDINIPLNERIVLCSTFDNMIVRIDEVDRVIAAFREFEGETSLGEQADILERIKNEEKYIAVAWHQTNLCESPWCVYDEAKEDYNPYNLNSGSKHHFLFDELEEASK